MEEPGSDDEAKSTPVANELRRLIKNGNLQRDPVINLALFSAARRELWLYKIKPALERGAIVLSARNYLSTLAYQGYGEGLDEDEIIRMTTCFTGPRYLTPDCLIVLALDDAARYDRIAKRGGAIDTDTFESRDEQFQRRVNHAYRELADRYHAVLIDASQPVEAVTEAVWRQVKDVLGDHGN